MHNFFRKSTNQLTNASQEETYLERNISDQKQATTTKNTVKVHSQSQKNQLELSILILVFIKILKP